jgi:sorbitol/mannitol transport system substrate-binding protein
MLFDTHRSKVAGQLGLAPAPVSATAASGAWLWTWALAIPSSSPHRAQAERFIAWATSRGYVRSVAARHGWIAVPPGTRKSTYASAQYLSAAPFAQSVYDAIVPGGAGDNAPTSQFGDVFEFEAIGDRTGQEIAKAVRHEQSVSTALKRAQNFALEQAGPR